MVLSTERICESLLLIQATFASERSGESLRHDLAGMIFIVIAIAPTEPINRADVRVAKKSVAGKLRGVRGARRWTQGEGREKEARRLMKGHAVGSFRFRAINLPRFVARLIYPALTGRGDRAGGGGGGGGGGGRWAREPLARDVDGRARRRAARRYAANTFNSPADKDRGGSSEPLSTPRPIMREVACYRILNRRGRTRDSEHASSVHVGRVC